MNHDFLPVHLIQTFVAFVESANITEAAGKIGLSQPAVSVHLRKFEEMLPETVFEMRGKRKVLSPYGQSIYDVVAPEFHKVVRRFSEASRGDYVKPAEVIRIGGTRSFTSIVVPRLKILGRTQAIDLKETEVLGEIQSGRIHYGIVQNQIRLKGLRCESLSSIRFDIVTQKGKLPKEVSGDWLKTHPFFAHSEHQELAQEYLTKALAEKGTIEASQVYNDWLAILQALKHQEGYSFVPRMDDLFTKALAKQPLDDMFEIDLYLLSLDSTTRILL